MKQAELEATLTRLEIKMDKLYESHFEIKTELAVHKVKSGFWGALMGAIVAICSHFVGKAN